LNKKTASGIVIYADKPVQGYYYFGTAGIFLAAAIVAGWFSGLYLESGDFRSAEDTGFLVFLFVVFAGLGYLFWLRVRKITDVVREKPLIRIQSDGITIFGDKFRSWNNIESIRLVNDFDQNYIELKGLISEDDINYRLQAPTETSEFLDLALFKSLLDRFTIKVVIQ
jgi:hypothetical protein